MVARVRDIKKSGIVPSTEEVLNNFGLSHRHLQILPSIEAGVVGLASHLLRFVLLVFKAYLAPWYLSNFLQLQWLVQSRRLTCGALGLTVMCEELYLQLLEQLLLLFQLDLQLPLLRHHIVGCLFFGDVAPQILHRVFFGPSFLFNELQVLVELALLLLYNLRIIRLLLFLVL
jgi:hypothetical protein